MKNEHPLVCVENTKGCYPEVDNTARLTLHIDFILRKVYKKCKLILCISHWLACLVGQQIRAHSWAKVVFNTMDGKSQISTHDIQKFTKSVAHDMVEDQDR